jgi:hypothetical protein
LKQQYRDRHDRDPAQVGDVDGRAGLVQQRALGEADRQHQPPRGGGPGHEPLRGRHRHAEQQRDDEQTDAAPVRDDGAEKAG